MKSNMKVVVFLPEAGFTVKQLEEIGPAVFYGEKVKDETELIDKCLNAEAVLATWGRTGMLSAKFFDSLPKLKFVSIYSTGYDWVDIEAARRNKVVVSYCPGYSTAAVADWTMSMIEKLCKPNGKTIGIIGLGRIGMAVAAKATRIGMKVAAWDRLQKTAYQMPLEKLLRESDVASIHLALGKETINFIGEREIAMMKNGAILINSAREPLVDNNALAKALQSGKLAGAAVDLDYHSKTILPKNAITTPHTAFNSLESTRLGNEMFVQNFVWWRNGKGQNKLT